MTSLNESAVITVALAEIMLSEDQSVLIRAVSSETAACVSYLN